MRQPGLVMICLVLHGLLPPAAPPAELGVDGSRFTIDGQPSFLLGMSYYAVLGAAEETVRRDLGEMKRRGFNWIRVWATWAAFGNEVSVVDGDGRPREEFLEKLRRLIAGCDQQGIVVDVTLSRGNGVVGPPRLRTLEAHSRAVETLVTTLRPYRNWYLDLANERNIEDRFTGFDELKELRGVARRLDPRRLVTASHAGDIDGKDLREYLLAVQVDFLCPHRHRNAGSPQETEAKSREYLARMNELGRVVPLHYQEPFRRTSPDSREWPLAPDFVADLEGAKAGGAAGWCFHNGHNPAKGDGRPRRSFDLRETRLFEQLDGEETRVLSLLTTLPKPAGGGPLRVHPQNPLYFTDGVRTFGGSLRAVYLTGSHTWPNLIDRGLRDPPPAFDFEWYLDFLSRHDHNFIRLWGRHVTWYHDYGDGRVLFAAPLAWPRTGPGMALDGKPKFDLDRFEEAYFRRLRSRVTAARDRGIYVSVMLFGGSYECRGGWRGNPFNAQNNVNGINGDPNGDGQGFETQTLEIPAVTRLQEAYLRKVIDTVSDLDNVLYEISNESDATSKDWQYHLIRYLQDQEAARNRRHPVGMTALWDNDNEALRASPAEWISPSTGGPEGLPKLPPADGRKVSLLDSDHWFIFAILKNPDFGRDWVWKAFCNGHQPLLMEQLPLDSGSEVPLTAEDPGHVASREAMGATRRLAARMDLAAMSPRPDLASTRHCLAAPGREYLVYQPAASEPFSVELTAGTYRLDWFDPRTNSLAGHRRLEWKGGGLRFEAPSGGPAVLRLKAAPALEIIAHRGASHDAPENTLAAVKLAWEQEADAIELDLWLSKDGKIVVIHDPDTQRVGGAAVSIAEQTWADLERLDVGGWKDPRFRSERIPTLDSILSSVPRGRRAILEIKCGAEILPELRRVIAASGRKPEELAIISFDFETLRRSKSEFPQVEHYFLHGYKQDPETGKAPELAPLLGKARSAGFAGLDLHFDWPIDASFVAGVRAAGMKLIVWTVNDPAVAKRLTAAGVDGITTDRPAWLQERLLERE